MIDYSKFADAIATYKDLGYEEIEVPWSVSRDAIDLTIPNGKEPDKLNDGTCLVSSAEQSFLEVLMRRPIYGKFQATTPCFRQEPVYDELHKPYFMKTELFINNIYHGGRYHSPLSVAEDAAIAMLIFLGYKPEIYRTGPDTWDIISRKGIELGSYGFGYDKSLGLWIYGTGLAEPRMSYAITQDRLSS